MTVQELISKLNIITDKSLQVFYDDTRGGLTSVMRVDTINLPKLVEPETIVLLY